MPSVLCNWRQNLAVDHEIHIHMLVRVCISCKSLGQSDFTRSPGPTKYVFQEYYWIKVCMEEERRVTKHSEEKFSDERGQFFWGSPDLCSYKYFAQNPITVGCIREENNNLWHAWISWDCLRMLQRTCIVL